MAICRYFQQGYCRFGTRCKYEHPSAGSSSQPQSSNRFGALAGGSGASSQTLAEKYNISTETIERDLTSEAPQWIFSAYAPGRDAPGQLFGGYPREQSFEELRLHYWLGKASGKEQEALSEAQELYTEAKTQMQNAARNSKDAVQFLLAAEEKHPNRLDICKQGTQGMPFGEFLVGKRRGLAVLDTAQPNAFGSNGSSSTLAASSATPSAFGQPSALGQQPNPFGAPAFGQPAQPSSASPFGQPSQPTPAFGQPSQPVSAFGQPSQAAQAATPFAQPSQAPSAFGQPSALGAKPNPFGAPAFGQPSQPAAQGNAFGQPSQLGQNAGAFASAANPTTNVSPFGSMGAGNNASTANPFGAPSTNQQNTTTSNPFASAGNAAPVPFGQPSTTPAAPSPFGQPSAPAASNPFASSAQGPSTASGNPFAQKSPEQPNGFASQPTQQQAANPFGQPSNSSSAAPQLVHTNSPLSPFASGQLKQQAGAASGNPYPPGSTRQHPPIESYSTKDMEGRLTMFKGKSVQYRNGKPGIREFDGTWKRIWFPNGPPGYAKDTEVPVEQYDEKCKAQWSAFAQTGKFEGGLMPELPPRRECTLWNF
ncbi:hypothetical protein G7046_g6480 [Stylonectria norvegica]|nr:hypothetical protein G7046_g6480 [Stylonectria norvegica]